MNLCSKNDGGESVWQHWRAFALNLNSEVQSLIFTKDTTLIVFYMKSALDKSKNQVNIGNIFRSSSPMVLKCTRNEKNINKCEVNSFTLA